jgi:hypothetical protein
MEAEELARALKRLADWAEQHAPEPEPAVRRRLREHFGSDLARIPVVSRTLAQWDRPNFQIAIDAWSQGRDVEVVGLPVMQGYRAGLAELALESPWMSALQLSAPEHVTVPLGEHESITCVTAGLWLVRDDDDGCAPAAATSAAGCCCTARPVRERRSPRCTSPPPCPSAPPCS